MTEAPLTIKLFGPLRVRVCGEPLPRVRTRSVEWLLALLALRCGREVDRSWLAGTLWPESPESRARQNLRNDLVELRKALGSEARRLLSPRPVSLLLDLSGADCDYPAFLSCLQAGDESSLRAAVELYAGSLLEGCQEEWIAPEREAAAEKCLTALEALATLAEEREDFAAAVRWLKRAEQLDPSRDSTVRRLMAALAAAGDRAAALEAFRAFRERLHRELSSAPDEATIRLFRDIRANARRAASSPAAFAGRGTSPSPPAHRPQQEGRRTVAVSRPPHALTHLVGRDEEAASVLERLNGSRLVTLVGTGGVGKTRLAAEVAAVLDEELEGGAAWVELAPLADEAFLVSTVAAAFGERDEGKDGGADLLANAARRIGDTPCLLALDNCEHLLDGAAKTIDRLLRSCRSLRVLATSRERLRLTGEVVWRVPSLPTPDPEAIPADEDGALAYARSFPSVQLFCDRAEEVCPGFALESMADIRAAASICRRLDGIPLAIELAAARVRAMSLPDLQAGLDDRFQLLTGGSRAALRRHQTLRAAIDYSYDMLHSAQQSVLRRLSVFRGGWDLEAAEAVCSGDGIEARDVRDHLDALVDKSLLGRSGGSGATRYEMLETVRQYAGEKLIQSNEADTVRARHLQHFQALAERAEPNLTGKDQAAWLDRLEADHDNLRAALDCSAGADPESGLRLAGAIWRFWNIRGHMSEGRARLAGLLAATDPSRRTPQRARAINAAGLLASSQTDSATAGAFFRESLAIYRELGDRRNIANSLNNLGTVARQLNDFEKARSLFEEALAMRRESGDRLGEAASLSNLGNVAWQTGDLDSARALFSEALEMNRQLANAWAIATQLNSLGHLACDREDFREARMLLRESIPIRRALNDRRNIPDSLDGMARAVAREYPLRAARFWGAAERLREEVEWVLFPIEAAELTKRIGAARAVLGDDAAFDAAWQEGRAMTLEQAVALALEEDPH